jgi:hypothetical protein
VWTRLQRPDRSWISLEGSDNRADHTGRSQIAESSGHLAQFVCGARATSGEAIAREVFAGMIDRYVAKKHKSRLPLL